MGGAEAPELDREGVVLDCLKVWQGRIGQARGIFRATGEVGPVAMVSTGSNIG